MNNPCKNCSKRSIKCHGNCKAYNAWKKYHVEQVLLQRKDMFANTVVIESVKAAIKRGGKNR